MKTTLLIALLFSSIYSNAQAKLFGIRERYVIKGSNQIIEVASNNIKDGVATYHNSQGKKSQIDVSAIAKETEEEIDGIQAGKSALARTGIRFSTDTTTRYCTVFSVFENKQAHIGCKTIEADRDLHDRNPNTSLPNQLNYIVQDVSTMVGEVEFLGDIHREDKLRLEVATELFKKGEKVEVVTIFANGQALVKATGLKGLRLNLLDNVDYVIHKYNIEMVNLSDLKKISN
ncbi:MAG: hypothetical protein K2Q18_04580 [Bdellovibrionales bacterium]|nr:hypothetical protein [Bdellovibrionales bacterium]